MKSIPQPAHVRIMSTPSGPTFARKIWVLHCWVDSPILPLMGRPGGSCRVPCRPRRAHGPAGAHVVDEKVLPVPRGLDGVAGALVLDGWGAGVVHQHEVGPVGELGAAHGLDDRG